jgi:D-3-phosphoglycerate dehydrogenase
VYLRYEDSRTPSELAKRSEGADIVMIANNPYPASAVEADAALKMIAVAFTGIDHVALDACRAKGVTVCNCAGYSDVSVAELTIGLTIDVLRKVRGRGCCSTLPARTSQGLVGREICRSGPSASSARDTSARRRDVSSHAFGAHVLGYARHENPEATAAGIEYVDRPRCAARRTATS